MLRRGVLAVVLAMVGGWYVLPAQPASATIHEIVAAACSNGQGNQLFPPGQSDPTKHSFVRALQSTGVIESITPDASGVVVSLDLDQPASKYVSSGHDVTIPDGAGPGVDVTLSPEGVPDPDFPAFANCENLAP